LNGAWDFPADQLSGARAFMLALPSPSAIGQCLPSSLGPARCLPEGKQAFNQFFPAAPPHGLVRIGFMHAPCRSVDVRKSLSLFNVDADSTNKKAAR
jgi:hypothetical protein